MRILPAILFILATILWLAVSRPDNTAAGRTTIRYMAWGNPEQLAAEQELILEFERRRPGIHVELFLVPNSAYGQKLQVMLASGTAPDVFRCDHYQFPAYVRRGYFLPLSPFVEADRDFRVGDYVPQAIQEGMYSNTLYGMNVLFGTRVIYYNKDLFRRAGLPDPYALYRRGEWTIDQFLDAAHRLTVADASGMTVQFGAVVNMLDAWTFAWAFGGDILTPDGSRCIADQPATIQALQFMQDLRHRWHATPTPAENALNAFTFESGKIAMNFDWAGATPRYRQFVRDFQWDVVPVPAGPAGRFSMIKGNQLLIAGNTQLPREAWEFVKFYVSRDAELILCGRLRRAMPTRRDVIASDEYLHTDLPPFQNDVWRDQYAMGRPLPITERWNEWQQAWSRYFELLMLKRLSADDTAKQAAAEINRILSEEPY